MVVSINMIRRPRTRKTTRAIRKEIKGEYNAIGDDIIDDLNHLIRAWGTKPEFKKRVTVSSRRWTLTVRYDKRTTAGKRFAWADKGTGLYGPKRRAYVIRPRNAKALRFTVPNTPKTLPPRAVTSRARRRPGAKREIVTGKVLHPGIRPRKFSERVRNRYANRRNRKGFYRRTENAARRGMRRSR